MGRRYGALNDFYDRIEAERQKDPILNRTGDFQTLFNDKDFMDAYYRHQMYYMDQIDAMETAYEKGREEGIEIEKGAIQKRFEIAKNLLIKRLSIDLIHETTGIDMETLRNLQQTIA
jgi:predicted transposase/invertase (TIGR01784 family)